jgi:hypothetical protein
VTDAALLIVRVEWDGGRTRITLISKLDVRSSERDEPFLPSPQTPEETARAVGSWVELALRSRGDPISRSV